MEMKKKVFDELRTIVYKECGISLSEQKLSLVTARVNKRLRELNIDTYEDYLQILIKSHDEMVHFLNAISTNTTSFFREKVHFELFDSLLKEWQSSGQSRFRVWCAAASSGEEPYTIAMSAREALGKNCANFKLLATDINTIVLNSAKKGCYDNEKMKNVPNYLLQKYFTKHKSNDSITWSANNSLKSLILYQRLNLITPPFPMKGPLDLVFCRNVMIYFDNKVRTRLVNDIYRLLKPGGYLFVGHSESLAGINSKFKTIKPAVYQK